MGCAAHVVNAADLGGDIHKNNPSEEMNLLEQNADGTPGYYGYPRCWSVGELNGYEPGTQMYQPGFESTTTYEYLRCCLSLCASSCILFCVLIHGFVLTVLLIHGVCNHGVVVSRCLSPRSLLITVQ